MEIPKEIEKAALRTYIGWKNKYEILKAAGTLTEKQKRLYSRGLRTGGLCYTMEIMNYASDTVAREQLEGLVTYVDDILQDIKDGNITNALNKIKTGLTEYVNLIKIHFPEIYDKHKEVLTWK